MAGSRTGTPLVIKLVRKICATVRKYGASDLAAATTPELAAAIGALMIACAAFEALDNFPGEIDGIPPDGPEDNSGGA